MPRVVTEQIHRQGEMTSGKRGILGSLDSSHVPKDFDRRHYKILFTKAQTHSEDAQGKDIVKAAYGREPIIVVKVDVSTSKVIGSETPPPHVHWGDIPTPMF